MPEVRVRLISLAMKPGAPREWMLSKRVAPAASPRSATSPRELTVGASRSPRNTQPYLALVLGEQLVAVVAHDARAVALGDEEAEVDVAAEGHRGAAPAISSRVCSSRVSSSLQLGDSGSPTVSPGRLGSLGRTPRRPRRPPAVRGWRAWARAPGDRREAREAGRCSWAGGAALGGDGDGLARGRPRRRWQRPAAIAARAAAQRAASVRLEQRMGRSVWPSGYFRPSGQLGGLMSSPAAARPVSDFRN